MGLGLWGTTQPTLRFSSMSLEAPSTVLSDSSTPRIEATRAQASFGNQKMCKVTVLLPGSPHPQFFCQALLHPVDTGGPSYGPKDHSLFYLILWCVSLVIIKGNASRCGKDLDGIRSDGWRTGPVNDGQCDSDSLSRTEAQGLCLLHWPSYTKCLQKCRIVVGA